MKLEDWRHWIVLSLVLVLAGCGIHSQYSPTPEPPGPPAATVRPPAPTVRPEPAPSTPPDPASSAGQPAVNLSAPLLIDGEQGRIYAGGLLNTEPRTLVLSTVDGHLLDAFEPAGRLALDRRQRRLIVDEGAAGLIVLDAHTGERLAAVSLPPQESVPDPQVDPQSGLVYAFRGDTLLVIDPATWAVTRTVALGIEAESCGAPAGPASVWRSAYDLVANRLYLTFITATCTPWMSVTIVAYDAATLEPLGSLLQDPTYQAVPFQGSLYGSTAPRIGPDSSWAWSGGEPWYLAAESQWRPLRGIVADWGRQLVVEGIGEEIRVLDAATHTLQRAAGGLPAGATLAGHDPISDQFYLLAGSGRLLIWPAADLVEATGAPRPAPSGLPTRPVRSLVLSPDWPADPTMAGLWDNGDCPVEGARLYIHSGAGVGWEQAPVSGDGVCDAVAAVVLGPDFGRDRTLFVASNDRETVLRSADGGRSWRGAATIFPAGTRFRSLEMASGTLWAHTMDGAVYRSTDEGQNWQQLPVQLDRLAVAPASGQEAPLLLGAAGEELLVSRDSGNVWTPVGQTPGGERLQLLSLAPFPAGQPAVFAFSDPGNFYRSLDGGLSWQNLMATTPAGEVQIAYQPGGDESQAVFLLHDAVLDNSYDGWDSTWSTMPRYAVAPAEITALAVSPAFAHDGLLVMGTADGQVIPAQAARPVPVN